MARFDDVVVNVNSDGKSLVCAALTASFINGLKTIAVEEGKPVMLPVIKMSYSEVISYTKLHILKVIEDAGGVVEDLAELSRLSGLGKPLLSYHINGAENSVGLVQMGLVKVSKNRRGRFKVAITELCMMLLASVLD